MDSQIAVFSSYLCVSCGKISCDGTTKIPVLHDKGGRQVKGLISIAKYLARKSNIKDILGRTAVDTAIVDQWLEYRLTGVAQISNEKDQHNMLKEMDKHLTDKVYMIGFYPTIADIVLYAGLITIMSELTFQDKQLYLHLSRWFDQVQHLPGVLQKNSKKIHFQKNLIYSSLGGH